LLNLYSRFGPLLFMFQATGGENEGRRRKSSGLVWRVSLSIIAFFSLIIFIILWLFFPATGFTVYQNLAIVFVSILIFFAIMGAVWVSLGMRWFRL